MATCLDNVNLYFLQIARIVESKNSEYPKGKIVTGSMGWTTYSVVDPGTTQVRHPMMEEVRNPR